MPDLPQISALLHNRGKPFGGCIGRAVIDVNDFIGPSAVEGGCDFSDQRTYVFSFVAHGDNDRDIDGGGVRR